MENITVNLGDGTDYHQQTLTGRWLAYRPSEQIGDPDWGIIRNEQGAILVYRHVAEKRKGALTRYRDLEAVRDVDGALLAAAAESFRTGRRITPQL
jgi:hypothetical protein